MLTLNAGVTNVATIIGLQEISGATGLTQADILIDPAAYQQMHGGAGGHDNRLVHIMRHFPSQEPQETFDHLHQIASSTNTDEVVEFLDTRNGNYIKYDVSSGTTLVLDEYSSPPPDFMVVTAYESELTYVANKISKGTWKAM
jgi:hypothetical protein